jgi:hypothetical protein
LPVGGVTGVRPKWGPIAEDRLVFSYIFLLLMDTKHN